MRYLKILAATLLAALACAGVALAVARATLPNTACEVSLAQVEGLTLEKMTDTNVRAALGCDGVVEKREDIGGRGEIVIEDVSWRMAVWPYGRFEAQFINGVLHGKTHKLVNLEVSSAPAE